MDREKAIQHSKSDPIFWKQQKVCVGPQDPVQGLGQQFGACELRSVVHEIIHTQNSRPFALIILRLRADYVICWRTKRLCWWNTHTYSQWAMECINSCWKMHPLMKQPFIIQIHQCTRLLWNVIMPELLLYTPSFFLCLTPQQVFTTNDDTYAFLNQYMYIYRLSNTYCIFIAILLVSYIHCIRPAFEPKTHPEDTNMY